MKALPIKTKLASKPTNNPQFFCEVKNSNGKSIKLADPKATRALVALMNQHATIGGAACHWGGPAAFAEIMSAAHGIMFNSKNDNWALDYNFINDAGHCENGIYALRANYGHDNLTLDDLKKFRSVESKLTGHGEAHLNPEGVLISNGPLGSGLGQAQGLAMADKILKNDRITICAISDGACMEGEAKEGFSAIAGLAKKGKLNPFLMLISDNNTKLSGRIDEDSYDMAPTFESLKTLGWNLITVEEGHNLQVVYSQIENAIKSLRNDSTKPIALLFKTIKGYGVKATEDSSSGGHGYPLKAYDEKLINFLEEIYEGNLPQEFKNWGESILDSKPETSSKSAGVPKEKVQPGLSRAASKATKEGLPVFSLSSDLQGSTGIKAFQQEFPEHAIDLGIAESNMVSAAVGLSKAGMIPIVDTFAQFGTTKGALPLIMAGLSQGPIIALYSHTGFQDAADGASHQSTTYLSMTSAIPHVDVISCACSTEAEAYMYQAIKQFEEKRAAGKAPNSVVFFYGRENHPVEYSSNLKYEWKKAQVLKEGDDIVIVSHGPLISKALEAQEKLNQEGISACVINHPFVNSPDIETIKTQVEKANGKVLIVEDHQKVGGFGQLLLATLAENNIKVTPKLLGVNNSFGQSAYKANQLYDIHKLGTDAIVEGSKEILK